MKTTICKSWTFDAAHRLPHHDGKCAQPHGHTYTLEVAVSGDPKLVVTDKDPIRLVPFPNEGMVIDFAVLGAIWKELEPILDHQDLNDSLKHEVTRTTSELLAEWLYEQFAARLPEEVELEYVRIGETASSWAMVQG